MGEVTPAGFETLRPNCASPQFWQNRIKSSSAMAHNICFVYALSSAAPGAPKVRPALRSNTVSAPNPRPVLPAPAPTADVMDVFDSLDQVISASGGLAKGRSLYKLSRSAEFVSPLACPSGRMRTRPCQGGSGSASTCTMHRSRGLRLFAHLCSLKGMVSSPARRATSATPLEGLQSSASAAAPAPRPATSVGGAEALASSKSAAQPSKPVLKADRPSPELSPGKLPPSKIRLLLINRSRFHCSFLRRWLEYGRAW